ncbi:hypothetical protein DJ90_4563 [Paenibacillus macerans]|uniref:Uncharacterized protein n=1 Tax=Paenibacillus macerans TaxID=44252 RepID=A0A090Z8R2_PAEMA|nr:hypothetical protein DJ90_4563 [Paenibacillus macerans]
MLELLAVAPYVGAWIESSNLASSSADMSSLPMWERGLKARQCG